MAHSASERYAAAHIHGTVEVFTSGICEGLMIFARDSGKFSRSALLCGLLALPLAAHAGRAYVSNEDEHTVTVIDTDKNAVVQTIQIGKRPRGIE
ncbi:MAG TPA: hypothetical protein VG994_17585, partial [Steroidobacteraceae bacterium]|nr:hypothetical protein [Steroidobacteraceae bacterium]